MTTLYQFTAQIGARQAPLILLLTQKSNEEQALAVFLKHLRTSTDLAKSPASATVKYSINSMSSALAANKVIDTSNNLMDVFPKYLFKAKVCTTTVQKLLSQPVTSKPTAPAAAKPSAPKKPSPKDNTPAKPLTHPIEKVGEVVHKVGKDIKKILS